METRHVQGIGFDAGRWPLAPEHPTVILIHGSGCDRTLWRAQLEGLPSTVNTVAIDLPGHGISRGPGCRTVPEHARRLADFLAHLRPPFPVPCGLSIGGAIVLQMLLDYPH